MFPEPSRFTIAFAIFDPVGATVQARFSVPAPVTGDPLTLKSDAGAARATLVTVPLPDPGKVWPLANVKSPLLLSFNPVSVGAAVPEPNSRLSVPDGVAVLLPTGSACQRKVSFTAAFVLLLNDEATRLRGCEFLPAVAFAVPVAGRPSAPRKMPLPVTSSVAAGAVLPMPTLVPLSKTSELAMSAAASNLASLFTVPPAVVTGVVPVASGCAVAPWLAPLIVVVRLAAAAASMKAEGGSPPSVCASAAWSA